MPTFFFEKKLRSIAHGLEERFPVLSHTMFSFHTITNETTGVTDESSQTLLSSAGYKSSLNLAKAYSIIGPYFEPLDQFWVFPHLLIHRVSLNKNVKDSFCCFVLPYFVLVLVGEYIVKSLLQEGKINAVFRLTVLSLFCFVILGC